MYNKVAEIAFGILVIYIYPCTFPFNILYMQTSAMLIAHLAYFCNDVRFTSFGLIKTYEMRRDHSTKCIIQIKNDMNC